MPPSSSPCYLLNFSVVESMSPPLQVQSNSSFFLTMLRINLLNFFLTSARIASSERAEAGTVTTSPSCLNGMSFFPRERRTVTI